MIAKMDIIRIILGFSLLCLVHCKNNETTTPKLTPLTSEEIFNKNQDAVVLIKHSYAYVIEIFGEKFYFRDYNPATGEISEFISYEEAKANPNESWGTGFFIRDDGSVLTNRHNVIVTPSKEERENIIQATKKAFISYLNELDIRYIGLRDELSNSEQQIYYTDYNSYEYDVLFQRINDLKNQIHSIEKEIAKLGSAMEKFEQNVNVSKTSFQFGVFLNNQMANDNFDNYIQYKSVKISDNDNVDLALLKPVNPNDVIGKIKITDMSKIDSVSIIAPKITQKVVMIGYNRGKELAHTSSGMKPQITEGNISQNTDEYKMLYTIPAMPGSSGSPIFDIYGRVVGVNFAGYTGTQSFNFGIQPQQIKKFLEGN